MKKSIYKYAPAFLFPACFILWLITFMIDRHYNYNYGLVWMPFIIVQLIIGTLCAVSIKNLYQKAHTDMLTGLCSRRYFHEKLSDMRMKSPVSLILIDIDNFKRINDRYGHMAGDQVLRQFADILRVNTRKKDIIARWGGEEFIVIFSKTDVNKAYMIANRIKNAVENHSFFYNDIILKITVSIGVAATEDTDTNMEQCFKNADKALYKAKEKKNFIVVFGRG